MRAPPGTTSPSSPLTAAITGSVAATLTASSETLTASRQRSKLNLNLYTCWGIFQSFTATGRGF